jgi:diguanylate cyclase (GGDEF)-like protein
MLTPVLLVQVSVSASLCNDEKLTPVEPTEFDLLTGMLIRPSFIAELIEQAVRANSTGHTFSLCLVDSDQQKNINLDYGQQTGDEVLAQVSRRLRRVLADGPDTVFGRYDGNCFGLLQNEFRRCLRHSRGVPSRRRFD